jgi:hypothetical protein
MTTLDEIKHALKRLDGDDREAIAAWLGILTDSRYVSLRNLNPRARLSTLPS